MNKLKELLQSGSDEQILNHVKNDLAPRIDTYIEAIRAVLDLKNELTKLQIESVKRQVEIEKIARALS